MAGADSLDSKRRSQTRGHIRPVKSPLDRASLAVFAPYRSRPRYARPELIYVEPSFLPQIAPTGGLSGCRA